MELTAEQIQENWSTLMDRIDTYISEPRKTKLKEFYSKYENRLMFIPASHKKEYHNAFVGGYVDHVLRVIDASLKINQVWSEFGVNESTYTIEELVFSALNHDLGKLGDEENDSYIPQTDKWRRDKLGEEWTYNTSITFASVPDRGLFFLQSNGIQYTFNEMVAIQTHDGLYDEGNKKYLMGWGSETKPRTSLPYILHQADLLAARIEWERTCLDALINVDDKPATTPTTKDTSFKLTKNNGAGMKTKALGSISGGVNLNKLFDEL